MISEGKRELLNKLKLDFIAFRRAIAHESDRGCALFAAAYLDKALSDILSLSLVSDKKVQEHLFQGNAPLASFSSRIKLAFYMGLISKGCQSDLDAIRAIRNHFAHHAEVATFEDQSICDKCKNLHYSYHERHAEPRAHFCASVSRILALLHFGAVSAIAPDQRPDDRPSEIEKAAARARMARRTADRNDEPDSQIDD